MIGGDQRPIDVEDLRRCTRYGGGYHESQPYIQAFWKVVETRLSPAQQGNLLKFITSCSRQPLLGFSQLHPPLGIQRVPLHENGMDIPLEGVSARLPTAATCMNLLKLPQYSSVEELETKLALAISYSSGFELS